MSADTAVAPYPNAVADEGIAPRALLAAVLVMSFSSLVLELSLTRVFSVILF